MQLVCSGQPSLFLFTPGHTARAPVQGACLLRQVVQPSRAIHWRQPVGGLKAIMVGEDDRFVTILVTVVATPRPLASKLWGFSWLRLAGVPASQMITALGSSSESEVHTCAARVETKLLWYASVFLASHPTEPWQ